MALRFFQLPGPVIALQALSLSVTVAVGVATVSKRVGATADDARWSGAAMRTSAHRGARQASGSAVSGSAGGRSERGGVPVTSATAVGGGTTTARAPSQQGASAPQGGSTAPGSAPQDASAVASDDASTGAAEDASNGADQDPVDYAVRQSEEDIPAGLSDEQRRALGTGPVPIHREGRYRSALAHPRFGPAARVRVGVVLNTVRGYDIRNGTYQADFFLALMSDRPMPALHLTFTNGTVSSQYAMVESPTLHVSRYVVDLHSPVDLRAYPFDTQQLSIEIEDQRAGVDQLIFEADPNRTALDEGFDVAGWGVAYLGARAFRHAYPSRFDRDDLYVSRYKLVLGIDRFSTSAAFSVFVPAFIIILISLTGLWMPAGRIDVRSATGAPMLAAAVLFHFSLMQALPATGYLTRADKLMLGVYLSLLLNMLSTWLFFVVRERNHDRVFRLGRMFVPPITALVMALASWV